RSIGEQRRLLSSAESNNLVISIVNPEVGLVAQAQIHSEVRPRLPVVLDEGGKCVEDIVRAQGRILLKTGWQPQQPLGPSVARPSATEVERSPVGIEHLMPVRIAESDFHAHFERVRSTRESHRVADFMRGRNYIEIGVATRAEITCK